MDLQSRLQKKAFSLGAVYFGVADLALARQGAVTPYEENFLSRFIYAVSVGVPLDNEIVDKIADARDTASLRRYYYHVYSAITPFIDEITDSLYTMLEEEGYSSWPVPASETIDTENQYSLFSHKMAASLAGLGWIGKSCLLITPDRGPRVRWGTVLTNAPLNPGQPINRKCGKCTQCIIACPAQTFTGRIFLSSEERNKRMSAQKCLEFLLERRKNIGVSACGMCVYVCPWGKPKAKSS